MKKINCNLTIFLTMITFNQAHAQNIVHNISGAFPEYICVHEVTKPDYSRKQITPNMSVKTYKYAYINEYMTCPPFISDYEIPENEIVNTDGVVWGIDDIDGGHIECPTPIAKECAVFDEFTSMEESHITACAIAIQHCTVVDTGHDCRPGLIPLQ